MSGIRIQPSGRITIDQPIIESTDLQSEIARADRIIVKVNSRPHDLRTDTAERALRG